MSVRPALNPERPLYQWTAIAAVLVVFAGFARTFYLKFAFDPEPMRALVLLHGIVMSAWFLLVVVQSTLVARGRTDLHRRLGIAGALLALAVLVAGTATAITAARLGRAPPGVPPLVFMVVPLGDMLVFAVLVGAGLWFRKRRDMHKRLMLLSSVGLLTAAIARWPIPGWRELGIPAYFPTTIALVALCIAYDSWRNRRLHPAFALGGLFIALSWPARLMFTKTVAWQQFADWVIG